MASEGAVLSFLGRRIRSSRTTPECQGALLGGVGGDGVNTSSGRPPTYKAKPSPLARGTVVYSQASFKYIHRNGTADRHTLSLRKPFPWQTLFPHPLDLPSAHLTPLAPRLLDQLGGAADLLERDGRVVGAAEPVEAPLAAGLEGVGEAVAVGARVDAAVAVAPAVGGGAPLVGAAVEDADAAAGHLGVSVWLGLGFAGGKGLFLCEWEGGGE